MEELEMEGPERVRVTTRRVQKVCRSLRLPVDLLSKIRQLAAINGISLSEVVTRLLSSGLKFTDYPAIRKGWVIHIRTPEDETAESKYFIPIELDQAIEGIVARGYSSRLVLQNSLEQGLLNAARRQHTKKREALDAGPVAPVLGQDAEASLPPDGELVPEAPEESP